MRTFVCACGTSWATELLGRFTTCDECKVRKGIERRTRSCAYRNCGKEFLDESRKNTVKFCNPECGRREKAFRSGKALDESYFRVSSGERIVPGGSGLRKCIRCEDRFLPEPEDKANRCLKCRDGARSKSCRRCGTSYIDESLKNSRRLCSGCAPLKEEASAKRGMPEHTLELRDLTPYTNTWYGRVGELLFLRMHEGAFDAVSEFGNLSPFDAYERKLGRVSVKTAGSHDSKYGVKKWGFQIEGDNRRSETSFFVGLSKARDRVERAWLIPSKDVPDRLISMSPDSREYDRSSTELSKEKVERLDAKFQSILAETVSPEKLPAREPRVQVEYDRIVLGKVGEAVYKFLNPKADHVSARNPTTPYDFVDSDGTTVNVRARRRNPDGRWTFFRSNGCTAKVYFFLGLDRSARTLERAYRVLAEDMPPAGFSVSQQGDSKWVPVDDIGLPRPVSDFVAVSQMDEIHLEISGLTKDLVASLSPSEKGLLTSNAFFYHRALGFPFPEIPNDALLEREVARVRAYLSNDRVLPADKAGLTFCSAYMPHRFKTRNENADFSAFSAFENDERLRRALAFCLRGEKPGLTRPALRSALTALNRTPTQFRPSVAYALVEAFCPPGETVFDPCAGWGGRAFGTIVSGRRYVGVEPRKETASALYRMGVRLSEFLGLPHAVMRIEETRIQDFVGESGKAGFALTSPPYFTREVYDEGRNVGSLEEWEADFLRPMFTKTRSVLQTGAFFAVNVSDLKTRKDPIPLERLTVEAALATGFTLDSIWRMEKGSFGAQESGRYEPVFVFKA